MSRVNNNDLERVRVSAFFDAEWYLHSYPDVAAIGIDPAVHFLKYGGLLRRDPGPNFSSSFYYDTRPGVEKKRINPLVHYLRFESGKNPQKDTVVYSLNRHLLMGKEKEVLRYLETSIGPELEYAKNIVLANHSLLHGDEDGWLKYFNVYLKRFEVSPLALKGDLGQGLFSRLYCNVDRIEVGGDLVSVVMPAWNSQETIYHSAKSILSQTWKNIELIIIDDCSTDDTWSVIESLKSEDGRVKALKNSVNVGPYVSKNIGLKYAEGKYITGHDADDWAHPQRIQKHMQLIKESNSPRASLTYMVRVMSNGFFENVSKVSSFSFDGVARKASISCMFESNFLRKTLGYWDSVRFGADSEMISRAESILGNEFKHFKQIGMVCLDLENSLTNNPVHGTRVNGALSNSRASYKESWKSWHTEKMDKENAYLDFPLKKRRYSAVTAMVVPYSDQLRCI